MQVDCFKMNYYFVLYLILCVLEKMEIKFCFRSGTQILICPVDNLNVKYIITAANNMDGTYIK